MRLHVALAFLAFASVRAFSAPGDLDATFGAGGQVTTDMGGDDGIAAVLLRPNGKIVAIGSSDQNPSRIAVAQYDALGAPDPGFGAGGTLTTTVPTDDAFGDDGVVLPDGRLVVAGRGANDFALVRYDAAGALDPTFGNDGVATIVPHPMNGAAQAIVRQPNGKLVAAGYVDNGTDFDFAVRRYEADGSIDLTFGDVGLVTTAFGSQRDIATDVVLAPDGRIVVVGYTYVTDSDTDIALARYRPDGSLDASFGLGGKVITGLAISDLANAVALQPDGKIVVVGTTNNYDVLVLRYDPDGALDSTFGTGGVQTISLTTSADYATDVQVLPDGKLQVSGVELNTSFPVRYEVVVLRLLSGGALDPGFGVGGVSTTGFTYDGLSTRMAVQPDGKIVVGGSVGKIVTPPRIPRDFDLLRYEGDPVACGNGVVESGEACDDGGVTAGDGCDATCQIESGFACAGMPSTCTAGCGDGAVAGSEACDDGGLAAGDGCGATCELEPGWTCAGAPSVCSPICGDSRIVGTEECDDGNTVGGDCCDATCHFEAVGMPCLDENGPCHTTDVCGGGGLCTHIVSPDPLCLLPVDSEKAKLKIVRSATGKNQLVFKWTKGPVVPLASFGDPPDGAPFYTLCVYDQSGGTATNIVRASPVATPFCNKDYGCWIASAAGWKYKANVGSPDGIVSLVLRAGLEPGKSKVQAKLKGTSFIPPSLPLAAGPAVIAEMRTSDGQCFGASFSTAVRNDAVQFSAKSD
jgi:uncharacterized delta-60 repeat protein